MSPKNPPQTVSAAKPVPTSNRVQQLFSVGPVLIVIAAVLWALDGIVRRSLFSLPPITIVFYEHLIGAALIAPFVTKAIKEKGLNLTKTVVLATATVSLFSGLLGTLWFTSALAMVNFIPFSVVFLLQKLQPLFTITSAHFFLGERITHKYLKWAALAIVAAYFVTFPMGVVNLATGGGTIMAALLAVGAAAMWGSTTAVSKILIKETQDHTIAAGLRFGATTILALAGVFLLEAQSSLATISGDQIGRLVFIAFSTGMVALWLYYKGLQTTQAKVATILELTFPLLAVFIDAVLYKMVLDPTQYLAAAVLMFAMYRVGKLEMEQHRLATAVAPSEPTRVNKKSRK